MQLAGARRRVDCQRSLSRSVKADVFIRTSMRGSQLGPWKKWRDGNLGFQYLDKKKSADSLGESYESTRVDPFFSHLE